MYLSSTTIHPLHSLSVCISTFHQQLNFNKTQCALLQHTYVIAQETEVQTQLISTCQSLENSAGHVTSTSSSLPAHLHQLLCELSTCVLLEDV